MNLLFPLSEILKYKKIRAGVLLLLATALILFCFPAAAETNVYDNLFGNPEMNALIDANHEEVVKNGYAELRIPESVHQIPVEFIDPNAMGAAQVLLDAGYEVYIIGGAVRDLVMNVRSSDFDLSTNATIEQQIELFGDMLTFHPVGEYQFGFLHYADEIVDLATTLNIPAFFYGMPGVPDFDPDQLYSDNYLFDSFERDLTINAIYYDVKTHELVTYHGGLYDLREGVLDTIGDPDVKLTGNPTAAVRALRFRARFNAVFSDRLEEAMRANAPVYISLVAPESNAFNMPRFFVNGYAVSCLNTLADYGVFTQIFAPVAEKYETAEYKEYLMAAMNWMDEWYAGGNLMEDELPLAAILWPLVAEEKDGLSIAERSAALFDIQNKTITIDDHSTEKIIEIYELQEKLTEAAGSAEAAEIMQAAQFENAYELLMIRACTDSSLANAAAFWTEMRETVMADPDEEENELAPAA